MDNMFILLCTCKVNSIFPSFVNIFIMMVLEDQIDSLNEE